MTHDPVPLERHFSLVPKSAADSAEQELNWIWGERKLTGWQDLEEEFRCVILAEAGAGKSFEMEARAKHAKGQGRAAFLIRIEDIEDGFETSFEVGSADEFENWLNSKEEAWFFLDSVDEARLENPRAFEKAIKRFAARIKPAHQRARVFISSRPYAWRARSDRVLIERYLPFIKPNQEKTAEHEGVVETTIAGKSAEPESALCVYRLDPLDEADIRKFADHRNTPQIDKLIVELQRADLMSMAARPFDLEVILEKWRADEALDGRLKMLQHSIDLHLKEIDPDRAQRQPINRKKARCGVRLLAAAVILTGEPGIRVPEDSTRPDNGIDAETVLGDWEPAEVQALLERGIFNDALYGLVRFRHREIRELLAAEWFEHQLNGGSSRHATVSLFFREQYGHTFISPRLRPILPWLILFDEEIRRKALEIAPAVAVEGGDAAHLPPAERKSLLKDIVRRITEDKFGSPIHSNSAIARIAHTDLTDDTLHLIKKHHDNDNAIFFLGRLVWQGEMSACVPALLEIAVDPARDIYARIAATLAVMTCGDRDQKNRMWNQLIELSKTIPRKLLAAFVGDADPDMASIDFLLASIGKLEAYERYETTGLSQALYGFIDRLPNSDAQGESERLTAVVRGLNEFLDREPHINQQFCHVSEKFAWLIGPATHAVERLVSVRSGAALSPDALTIMLKAPVAHFWRGDDFDQYKSGLRELVPTWDRLNDALFWRSVEEKRDSLEAKNSERLIDHWSVQWIRHYCNFEKDRFCDVVDFIAKRDFLDDKLVALSLAHWLFVQAGKPEDWLSKLECAVEGNSVLTDQLDSLLNPKISQSVVEREEKDARQKEKLRRKEEEHNRNRAEWIERLKAAPDIVRHPPGLESGEISDDQCWLLREIEGSGRRKNRGGEANWEALRGEFGEDVARAYRDAAVAHWRAFTPGLLSEGHDTSSILRPLIFAMAGLEIVSSEVDGFPANLTEAQVQHALRYLVWGLDGFPSWFEKLYQAYPKLVLDAVLTELHWVLSHTEPDQPLHRILHDLVYCASWMHEFLAPSISAWLEQNEILNHDALRYCIHILRSGDADREAVSIFAHSKISSNAAKEQLATWYALWIDFDAEHGIPAAEKWLSNLSTEEASKEAQLLITILMGTPQSSNSDYGCGDFRKVKHLKTLFVLMHRHIPAKDDLNHTGVFSPELRDDAQDCRNALLDQLSEIPGKETYIALCELARDHPDANHRPWMKKRAYKRAEEDSDLEPWTAEQVWEYDQYQERTPTTHRQLFDLAVDRLNDLRAWIEHGKNSPYRNWQKAEDEPEMRNLVAGWLNVQQAGRYTCAQENEFSNRQRPDLLMQSAQVGSAVPIELRVIDNGWSGPKLCERLRNQLADYLREETAGCGVFLLVWRGQSDKREWEIDGKRVRLPRLRDALVEYWGAVSDRFPGVSEIEVILIDLTIRDSKSES